MNKTELNDAEMNAFVSYKGRVYEDQEVVEYAPFAIVRTFLELIISQNNLLIRLAQEANEKMGAKRKAALEELCDKLYPAHDVRGNCSRHALLGLKEELLRAKRPGMIARERMMVGQMKVVKDTTATLFNRLERIKHTGALKAAQQAIYHIYDLLIDPDWHGMNAATFCADVGETFKAFFDACQENARLLQNEFGIKVLRKDIREVKEISNANLFESSCHEQGQPMSDGRESSALKHKWASEGADFVLNENKTISEAARRVMGRHKDDRTRAYCPNQLAALRKAIEREVAARAK